MLREWANKETMADIEKALRPPASWRDPETGLPAGWEHEDETDWSMYR